MENKKLFLGILSIILILTLDKPSYSAEELTAKEASAKYKTAVSFIKRQKYRSAIDLLNEIVESEIDDKAQLADALNLLGISYRKSKKTSFAIEYYMDALKIDPKHKGANEYIGEAYLELNKPLQAAKYLKVLKNLCGKDCAEYQNLKHSFDRFLKKSGKDISQY